MGRLNSEKIFSDDSVNDAASMLIPSIWIFETNPGIEPTYDIKIKTRFLENPILEILIKILNCAGSTNIRRCSPMIICLIAIHNCPVILRDY